MTEKNSTSAVCGSSQEPEKLSDYRQLQVKH